MGVIVIAGTTLLLLTAQSPASAAITGPPTVIASPERYSPEMSSTPGIHLTVTGVPVQYGTTPTLIWRASAGSFLQWSPPDYRVVPFGSRYTTDGEGIYWTWYPGENQSVVEPPRVVRVRVTIQPSTGTKPQLYANLTLAWKGEWFEVVRVGTNGNRG
jgi:hypothetical protein